MLRLGASFSSILTLDEYNKLLHAKNHAIVSKCLMRDHMNYSFVQFKYSPKCRTKNFKLGICNALRHKSLLFFKTIDRCKKCQSNTHIDHKETKANGIYSKKDGKQKENRSCI